MKRYQTIAFCFKQNDHTTVLDLALLIIEPPIENISELKFYDTTDENQDNHTYCTAGYPYYLEEIQTENKLNFYYLKPISNHKNSTELFINTDGSLNFYDYEFIEKLKGMSGSGIFLLGKNGEVALRSIIFKALPTNKFECIKLDEVLDKINEKLQNLNLEQISTITKPLSINNEVVNLSDFIEVESVREFIRKQSTLNGENIKKPDDVREKARDLNEQYKTAKRTINELSYQYAHLALFARDKKMQLATSRFFKRAIDLNPTHITAFLLEKSEHEKQKNIQDIHKITPKNAIEIYKKYKQLIEMESSNANKIKLIKEAIENLSYLIDDDNIQNSINEFSTKLNKIYDQDRTVKPIFKYQELAAFYHKIPQKTHSALYYNQLSLYLIENSINPVIYEEERNQITHMISILHKSTSPLSNNDIIKIKDKAQNIFAYEEDKSLKELLYKISYDINRLKEDKNTQEETSKDIINSLFSLNIQGQTLVKKAEENKLDIGLSNKNNIEIKNTLNTIDELVNGIQEKHVPQLDENTKYELRSIIEEPAETLNAVLGEISHIVREAITYIDNSEKSLNTLINHEKSELENIHQQIYGQLSEFSDQYSKLNLERNEVLTFLKISEKRMLTHIHRIDVNIKDREATTALIQQSIHSLKKITKEFSLQKNESDFRSKLKKITDTCQLLEQNILSQISHYEDEFDLIKRGQNRIEHSLIKKTIEALSAHAENRKSITNIEDNQDNITRLLTGQNSKTNMPPEIAHDFINSTRSLSSLEKVLLVISILSVITAMGAIFSLYR